MMLGRASPKLLAAEVQRSLTCHLALLVRFTRQKVWSGKTLS